MREFATVAIFFGMLYAAVVAMQSRPNPAFSVAPAVSRDSAAETPIAPAAATINAGASYEPYEGTVALAERGGDLQSSRVPRETEQEAQAPAGADPSPAGAFISHQVSPSLSGNCQCGENCPCRLSKNEPVSLSQPAELKQISTALAQRPAPVQPVPAMPAAVPYYQPQPVWRPTWASYYQSSCGAGGCAPAGGFRFFRRGR